MKDVVLIIVGAIVLAVATINAIRTENTLDAITDEIEKIKKNTEIEASQAVQAIEASNASIARLNSIERQIKDLDSKVIDIIKRYINFRTPNNEE